ncbi:MAG TPA: hypothetical protein ENJ52_11630 [Aliiroseovarius sp.]|nr:hypothetical protein [Aliiroseovarius sp.]
MRKGLRIELLDDVITSASSATAATPRALAYIPGAMLLGAAAAGRNWPVEQAFALFQSGALRFDDGLPVDQAGALALPVPMSLHRRKGSDANLADRQGDILDCAACDPAAGFSALRDRSYCTNGHEHVVRSRTSLRTAIDPATGRAAEGQLFGYEALRAGQVFWAGLEGPKDQVDDIAQCLEGEHFLGRSRSAEFGRVRITTVEPWQLSPDGTGETTRYVWFLSDFWAVGSNGLPTARPGAEALATTGTVLWQRSFTRMRRFAPYNAHWHKRAPERDLISRGSVLVLEDCPLPLGLHRFGIGQELGYGLALVSDRPPGEALLALEQPDVPMPDPRPAAGSQTRVVKWLAKMAERDAGGKEIERKVQRDVADLRKYYISARRLKGGQEAGPGRSQWGRLEAGLRNGEKVAALMDTKPWDDRFKAGDKATFKAMLEDRSPERLAHLAKAMLAAMAQEGWPDAD